MIIEFNVTNFKSIKSKQTLSLVKSKNTELTTTNTFQSAVDGVTDLLNTAVIYGANASGKSNLFQALDVMQDIIKNSAQKSQRGDKLSVIPFKLCESTLESPTEFEIIFIAAGIKYQYGFSVTTDKILEEWLFAFPKKRPQRWFIRAFDEKTATYHWDFSTYLTGQKKNWQDATRDNALFLSTAVLLNSEKLQPVFDWLTKTLLLTVGLDGWGNGFSAGYCEVPAGKTEILNFLKSADVGIDDLNIEKTAFDINMLPDELPELLKKQLSTDLEGEDIIKVKTVHQTIQGKDITFSLEDESDGTQKLFALAGPWIHVLNHGMVLFIDELHNSLHPNIVRFLIQLFHNKKTNPKNAQLIFTTHETAILDQAIFRRDQIWFCKKDETLATILYPLSDFSPRKKVENIERAYLDGRYGALPVISRLDLSGA